MMESSAAAAGGVGAGSSAGATEVTMDVNILLYISADLPELFAAVVMYWTVRSKLAVSLGRIYLSV